MRRRAFRPTIGERVGELLLRRPAVWVAGVLSTTMTVLVHPDIESPAAIALALTLVVLGTGIIVARDRWWIVGGRPIVRRDRRSRRQLLALGIAVGAVTVGTGLLAWWLRSTMHAVYEEARAQRRLPSRRQ
jgi:hypothetical protein